MNGCVTGEVLQSEGWLCDGEGLESLTGGCEIEPDGGEEEGGALYVNLCLTTALWSG